MRINFMTSCFEHIAKSINCQETRYLARQPLSRKTCEGKSKPSESTTSVMITLTISSHESSSLANCSPLDVSVHCCLVLYSPSKKLVFVPIASATAGGHRDCPVLASVAQWPEIQPLVSRG